MHAAVQTAIGRMPDFASLSGKIALVTGAGQGTGEAASHALARLGARAQAALADPQKVWKVVGRSPMARAATPEEIANVVAFLASEESSYMTGAEVAVDGGFLAC